MTPEERSIRHKLFYWYMKAVSYILWTITNKELYIKIKSKDTRYDDFLNKDKIKYVIINKQTNNEVGEINFNAETIEFTYCIDDNRLMMLFDKIVNELIFLHNYK